MGEFKPRNPDIDLLYRGEKSISDSIKRNTKAIKNIDLSEVNVEVNTDSISDAIHESATANTDALEGVAGTIQNVQRFIDYSEKLEEIVNAISALNYGEELQIEINEVEDVIEQIIEDYEKLKSDYEQTTEETLSDITLLNENYNNLLQNFTNLTETVNSIIEKIGDIPTDISEELEEIKEEIEKIKSKIENIPDNVSEKLDKIEEKIYNINNLKCYTATFNKAMYFAEIINNGSQVIINVSDKLPAIKVELEIETELFTYDDIVSYNVSGWAMENNVMYPQIGNEIHATENGVCINVYIYATSSLYVYRNCDFKVFIVYLDKGE